MPVILNSLFLVCCSIRLGNSVTIRVLLGLRFLNFLWLNNWIPCIMVLLFLLWKSDTMKLVDNRNSNLLTQAKLIISTQNLVSLLIWMEFVSVWLICCDFASSILVCNYLNSNEHFTIDLNYWSVLIASDHFSWTSTQNIDDIYKSTEALPRTVLEITLFLMN